MSLLFADTFYFVAMVNPDDRWHVPAKEAAHQALLHDARLVTTTWVLTEFGDALSHPRHRSRFWLTLEGLRRDPLALIVPPSPGLFDRAAWLYRSRPDKGWSLTDCVSFVVMQDLQIAEALTGDHHFEQAGFKALLKR